MKKKTLEEQAKRYVERLKPESTSEAKSYFRAFYDKKKSKQKAVEEKDFKKSFDKLMGKQEWGKFLNKMKITNSRA